MGPIIPKVTVIGFQPKAELESLLAVELRPLLDRLTTDALLTVPSEFLREGADRAAAWAIANDLLYGATTTTLAGLVQEYDTGCTLKTRPDHIDASLVTRMRLLARVPASWPLSQLSYSSPGARLLGLVILQMRPQLGSVDLWLREQLSAQEPLIRFQASIAIDANYGSIARASRDGAWKQLEEAREVLINKGTTTYDLMASAHLDRVTSHLDDRIDNNQRLRAIGTLRRAAKRTARVEKLGAAKVRFAKSDVVLQWDDGDSILDLAAANNLELPSSCQAGTCGTCLTRLLAGKVHYLAAPAFPIEEGYCLLCIGLPDGEVTLDA